MDSDAREVIKEEPPRSLMKLVLVGLALSYALINTAAFVAGLAVTDASGFKVHFALGLVTTLFTCLMYCVILTYFIITGKLIKSAVQRGHLDDAFIPRSQGLKARMTALIPVAIGATLTAAILGARASDSGGVYGQDATSHLIAAAVAMTANLGALFLIYQHVHHNSDLVAEVFDTLDNRTTVQ